MIFNLVCKSVLPAVPFGTLSNFSFVVCFTSSNIWINASTSAFSFGVTKPSDVTSAILVSTADFACSALATAWPASDSWSVSNTPLLSVSFTSGDAPQTIVYTLVGKSALPAVPFGTLSNFSFVVCFTSSNISINASTSALSFGVTKPSDVTSAILVSTADFACSALATAWSASDNWSVSNTPLLSASFTSGDVTDVMLSSFVC